jgi:Family of unknown function (DUF6489)
MKIHIEVELTPDEARSLLGMPNITALQDAFVGIAKEKLEKTGGLVDVEPMLKAWTGLGGFATDTITSLIGAAVKGATESSSKGGGAGRSTDAGSDKPK